MKCPECGRHNDDINSFCRFCAALLSKISKKNQVIVPPQDISFTLKDRRLRLPIRRHTLSSIIVPLLVVIAIVGAYYILYYVNIYQVQAIEYSITNE